MKNYMTTGAFAKGKKPEDGRTFPQRKGGLIEL
jgi:hypothetical protein